MLDYRVMRETTTTGVVVMGDDKKNNNTTNSEQQSTSQGPGLLQILTLPHHPQQQQQQQGRSFVCVSRGHHHPPPPPLKEQGPDAQTNGEDKHQQHRRQQHSPQPVIVAIPHGTHTEELMVLLRTRLGPLWTSRHTLGVINGAAFEMEDFRVRVGDLRVVSGRQTMGTQASRGVLVEVEWVGDGDGGGDGGGTVGEEVLKAFWERLELGRLGVVGGGTGLELARLYCEVLRAGG